MARITFEDLAHAYPGGKPGAPPAAYALKPTLDLAWEDGGAYALLGPSGCGKTTLLNIVSGLLRPSQGRVLFDGRDVTALPPEARDVAQVFQFPVVYETMTVRENLLFPLRNRRVPEARARAKAEEVADLLGLTRLLGRRARDLGADEKQKVSLGRGLVRDGVAAILFDEPLTVVDPGLKWELRARLKDLHRRVPVTMVYVTHDQTEALTFADRVVVMADGEAVQVGTPAELFERPAHTFVGHFIGSPGMNLMPLAMVDGARAVLAGGDTVTLTAAVPREATPPGAHLQLGVRPEHTRLLPTGSLGAGGVPARLRRVEDHGRRRIARLEVPGGTQVAAVLPPGDALGPDTSVRLSFDPARTHLYADGRLVSGRAAA